MNMRRLTITFAALGASLLLASCATQPGYGAQTTRYAFQPGQRSAAGGDYGRVASIEVIRTQTGGATPGATGIIAGGAIGGLIGNQFGKSSGRAAATALGVVGGAFLGNAVEAEVLAPQVHEVFRITIRTDYGVTRTVDAPSAGNIRVGDRVTIDATGAITRL